MTKIRLVSLLIALCLAVFAMVSAPPAAQATPNCSQFNKPGCTYYWDASAGCCRPFVVGPCVWYCF